MINFGKLIARNLRRNFRRTLLTTLTIALATFILAILISVPASIDRLVSDASESLRLVVSNRTAPWEDLPARYCDDVRKMRGAVACVAISGWFGVYRDVSAPILAYAAGPEMSDVYPDYDPFGKHRKLAAHERRAAFAGEVLTRKNGWKVGQLITLHGTDAGHLNLTFVLLGTIESKHYPNSFVFQRDYLMEARKAAGYPDADTAWFLVVRADRADHLAALAKSIDEHFTNSDYQTRTVTESDALASNLSAMGNLKAIILSLVAVVILTVLLIAANSAAMMVRERIGEVAIMRALGFGRESVAALLFGECGAIGLLGGLIGSDFACWLFHGGVTLGVVLNGNGALWVTPWQAVGALVIALGVTLVSGLVPVLEALRISPASAFHKIV